MDSHKQKREVRARIIAQREALPAETREAWSRAITERLTAMPEYRAARLVAAYASYRGEFDTAAFIEDALSCGKRVVVPRVSPGRDRIDFYCIADRTRDLAPGAWGIPEPVPGCGALGDAEAPDLMLTPGVAFTRGGERLGYGRGFYDQFLARHPGLGPLLVAAAFSVQLVERLPTEAHDRRVQRLVTERETIVIENESGPTP